MHQPRTHAAGFMDSYRCCNAQTDECLAALAPLALLLVPSSCTYSTLSSSPISCSLSYCIYCLLSLRTRSFALVVSHINICPGPLAHISRHICRSSLATVSHLASLLHPSSPFFFSFLFFSLLCPSSSCVFYSSFLPQSSLVHVCVFGFVSLVIHVCIVPLYALHHV